MTKFKIKKEIKEWSIFAIILLTLYFTGLHTEVVAFAQRAFLATGIVNPDTEPLTNKEKAAYNFTLKNMDGSTLDFRTVKGKVIFINMWATWCPPCIAEMPGIQKMYNKYKKNPKIVFAMISVDTSQKKVKKFINRKKYNMPIYFLNNTKLPEVYMSTAIPATFVIDKKGYISYKKLGMANYNSKSFIQMMDKLIVE